jgi:hypothetical protein
LLFRRIYVPKAMENAGNGEVGLLFILGGNGSGGLSPGRTFSGRVGKQFTIEGLTDKLAQAGEIPPLIVVWPADDGGTVECRDNRLAIDQWEAFLFPWLKEQYPKLSDKPDMRVVMGQSTEGSKAFDFAWRAPHLFGKVFSGSGSFVCFMRLGQTAFQDNTNPGMIDCPKTQGKCCPITEKGEEPLPGCDNFGYGKLIRACPKKNIRVTMSVGKNDITPQGVPGQDDTSSCQANWLETNKDVKDALDEKSTAYQFIITPEGHGPNSWVAYAGDRFRWLFKDVMCFE